MSNDGLRHRPGPSRVDPSPWYHSCAALRLPLDYCEGVPILFCEEAGMPIKFIRRWLFGREIGALLHISQQTEWGIGGRDASGMTMKGTSQPGGFQVKTGAVEGKWEVVNKRQPIDHIDVFVAERGIEEFIAALDDANTIEAAKLLGIFDYAALKKVVGDKLRNHRTHLGPVTPGLEEMDNWVRAEIVNRHPELAGNGAGDEE